MNTNYTKSIRSSLVLSLVLATSLKPIYAHAASNQLSTIGGINNYETAAKVATTNWTTSKDVVLVSGEGFADAVSATILAKQLNAPILLTTSSSLDENAKNALNLLKAQNVYIIGGTASISQSVRNLLLDSKYNLIELGGKDRYETNIAVANELVKLGASTENIMLVSGEGFADVLSATPIAAAKGQLLLLGNNSPSSMKSTLDFIKSNNCKVTVIGTNFSINDNIYKSVGAIKRVSGGSNRFETNLNVLNEFKNDLKYDKIFISNAGGDRYSDALIASSLAGKSVAPLLLLDDNTNVSTNNALNYIKNMSNSTTELNIVKSSDAISDTIIEKIKSLTSSANTNSDSPTVGSVSSNGLNQIKVVFNTDLDKDSAEQITNYQLDGATLNSNSSATLQDDNRTVLITFPNPFTQYTTVNFTVNSSILSKNKNNNITKYDEKITFSDTTPPKLESLTMRGGNKLIVKFSKPIRMTNNDLSSMKINRQSVSNYGLNLSMTTLGEKSDVWADKVELYFNSPLPIGNNTFTMPNGELGKKFDSAGGFTISAFSSNFSVESISGVPQVTSVTYDNAGAIFINYNRPMDKQSALECSNYTLNGSNIGVGSSNIEFVKGSNDQIVKISGLNYLIKNDSNELVIKDNLKDTYGTQLTQTTMKFNNEVNSTKPQVTSVNITDNKTIRVKFNKPVSYSYATNKSNYKILKSDGSDISYKIKSIDAINEGDSNFNQSFNIKFDDYDALKDSRYSITIRNIIDTSSALNIMDDYTTNISGFGTEGVKVSEIVRAVDNSQDVVIFFNKAMNESSLLNSNNYYFVDGTGKTNNLPSSVSISTGSDGKSVTLSFPTSYIISNGYGEQNVLKIGVTNVTDKNGQSLDSIAYCANVSTNYNNGPKLISGSSKLTYDGNDIKVKFSLTAPLDIVNLNDFKVCSQTPDSIFVDGTDITLTFKAGIDKNQKIDTINNCGGSTVLNVSGGLSVDVAGRKLQGNSDTVLIPPRTLPKLWYASSNIGSGSNSSVSIVFNESIDSNIRSTYTDDFIFTNKRTGEKLNVLSVDVNGSTLTFNFNYGSMKVGDSIDVRATDISSNISIRSNVDSTLYIPSGDDLKNRTLIVH
ncbi:MAG: cell wall-binding repeat-containing protein [Clostridiaceae bacterium]|nr:cell wall-binding repeat-containing protein [Clostridiaceae bacterium]